jgi:hypothetical protein
MKKSVIAVALLVAANAVIAAESSPFPIHSDEYGSLIESMQEHGQDAPSVSAAVTAESWAIPVDEYTSSIKSMQAYGPDVPSTSGPATTASSPFPINSDEYASITRSVTGAGNEAFASSSVFPDTDRAEPYSASPTSVLEDPTQSTGMSPESERGIY